MIAEPKPEPPEQRANAVAKWETMRSNLGKLEWAKPEPPKRPPMETIAIVAQKPLPGLSHEALKRLGLGERAAP